MRIVALSKAGENAPLKTRSALGRPSRTPPQSVALPVRNRCGQTLPAHLPRERVMVPAPSSCPCCGGRLVKLGEDITETLEVVPRHWKVIQTVREKFTCRSCERITQPPAPFHVIARARAGASLLAMILYAKFGEHQPLNRQSEMFAREGIELDVSTLADWVGACTASLAPLVELIRRHVLAGERLHGDDTTVPVLAKDKTVIGRLWTYVRDDRPFAGPDPPAAVFFYSRNRGGEHPSRHLAGYAGILQADAYAGFGDLYDARRRPGPITEAACWSHGRRKFFVLADLGKRRLLSLRSAGSTKSSRSSVKSTALRPSSGSRSARIGSGRLSASSRDGCVPNAPGCHVMPTLPRRWTTSPHSLLALAGTFYKAGALVFGGGHVVLPLLRDALVPQGWLSDNAFLAGYGVAQAIPGPLFTFSAYLGAAVAPAGAAPLWSAVALIFIF